MESAGILVKLESLHAELDDVRNHVMKSFTLQAENNESTLQVTTSVTSRIDMIDDEIKRIKSELFDKFAILEHRLCATETRSMLCSVMCYSLIKDESL